MINISCVHPYFASLCDQFRIHDYDHPNLRSPISVMKYRTEFAEAVMPGVLVDMDGFSAFTREEMLRTVLANASLGVPDLYTFPSQLGDEEWEAVRMAWKEYSDRLTKS